MKLLTFFIIILIVFIVLLIVFFAIFVRISGPGLPPGWKNAYGPPDSYQSKIAEAFADRDELIAHSEMRHELYKIIEEERGKI